MHWIGHSISPDLESEELLINGENMRSSLAHLLAAAFEVLGFELPVFVIRLGKMVGVDERIATPEPAKYLFPAWESNRIVSDPPSWAVV